MKVRVTADWELRRFHGEIDHIGALPELLRRIPGTPVVRMANAVCLGAKELM